MGCVPEVRVLVWMRVSPSDKAWQLKLERSLVLGGGE